MLLDKGIQHKLAEMHDKLQSEAELRNEIVFFMHNCLIADLKDVNSSKTLPCAQVICKHLASFKRTDFDDKKLTYVLQRALSALEIVTRKNRGMLSSLAIEFQLYRSLSLIANESKSTDSVAEL